MSTAVLTGGIASGKSTVALMLADRGIRMLDTDSVAAALTASGGRAVSPLREVFGESCLGPDGAMDRAAMRERVFRDPAQRKALEGILHPLIRLQVDRFLREVKGERAVVAIPLYFESLSYRGQFSQAVTLDCSVGTQVERLVGDRGLDRALAISIVQVQVCRQVRLQLADRVICNNRARDRLAASVDAWLQTWE